MDRKGIWAKCRYVELAKMVYDSMTASYGSLRYSSVSCSSNTTGPRSLQDCVGRGEITPADGLSDPPLLTWVKARCELAQISLGSQLMNRQSCEGENTVTPSRSQSHSPCVCK